MNELLAVLCGLFSLAVWCALALSKRLDGDDYRRGADGAASHEREAHMNAAFRAANRAYDDRRLNDHLRDWDVSEARDRAIEERADELLEHDYAPFGDTVFGQFCDEHDLRDVLGDTLQHLIAGDHTAAGSVIAERLKAYARKLAKEEAESQVDAEWEARRDDAADAARDDREWARHYDSPRFR